MCKENAQVERGLLVLHAESGHPPKKNSDEITVTYESEKNMGRIEPTGTTNKRGGKCSTLVVSHWRRVAPSPMLEG